ncbi:hypothetical protein CVIRNUC_002389 [Coccomyxa viridis]|uniref:Generative cell specific-1/HAP2 domain-containing protein n=1 Tax=Coccomyxa viridis TaxID=1274662 RepID=A0AAV1HYU5_9CHLO|nr:hypothetical protein CVIRNUC_002389 [Coccomyxa viridis]
MHNVRGADSTCQCRDLAQALNVTITKSAVYASYPLIYQQAFNYQPYEAIIRTGGGNPITSCNDDPLSTTPTCGWATDASGSNVYASQGFCCSCTSSALAAATLTSGTNQQTRANLNCDLLNSWFHLPGSASCLRMDPLNYQVRGTLFTIPGTAVRAEGTPPHGYLVDAARLAFDIYVTVQSNASSAVQALHLGPTEPFSATPDAMVSAQLLGDLSSYSAMPDFSSFYLMIPSPAGMTPQQVLQSNTDRWMMIPSSGVDLTGTVCNKVGTSYTAFRYGQTSACQQPQGSCLGNQLADYYNADIARIGQGTTPISFVSRWGAGGSLYFGLPVTSILNSLVTLSVDASTVALVCQFNNATCGVFQALTQRGYLTATVQNTGAVASGYYVEVTNCSSTVLPVSAQYTALVAQGTASLTFDIFLTSSVADQGLGCVVSLVNTLGAITDVYGVSFAANATAFTPTVAQSDISSKALAFLS